MIEVTEALSITGIKSGGGNKANYGVADNGIVEIEAPTPMNQPQFKTPAAVIIDDPYISSAPSPPHQQKPHKQNNRFDYENSCYVNDGVETANISQPYYGLKYLFQTPYGLLKLIECGFAIAIITITIFDAGDWFTLFIASFQLATALYMFAHNLCRWPFLRWSPNMLLDFFLTTSGTLLLFGGGTLVGALWPESLSQLVILLPVIFVDALISLIDTILTLRRYFRANDCALFYYSSSDSVLNSNHVATINNNENLKPTPPLQVKKRQQNCDIIADNVTV